MIIKFKIFESKYVNQRAYHFTSELSLIDIVKCDCLKAMNTGFISLTRDKFLYDKSDYISPEIRIVLDIEKLTNDYKIIPYQQVSNIFDKELKSLKSKWKGHPERDLTTIESEEKVLIKKISNLHKYIISIDFRSKDKYQLRFDRNIFDNINLQNYINKYNIKINKMSY